MLRCQLVAAFVTALLVLACSPPEDRAERARETIQLALQRGDRAAALDALEDLRESQPDTPEGVIELSSLLISAGEAPQARWLLEDALTRFPERDDLRLALGQVALLIGDAIAARSAVEAIAPDSEHHPGALVLMAQAELRLGDLERSLEILADAERRYPQRLEARLARIATLLGEERHEAAREALDEARGLPTSSDAERATLRQLEVTTYAIAARQGETDTAIEGLRALLQEEPGDVYAWQALAQTLASVGRLEEGVDLMRDALEADPDRLALYPVAASLLVSAGREAEAESTFREFVDRSGSSSAFLELALYHLMKRDETRSLAVFDEAIELFPEEPMLRRAHAEALLTFGRTDEAAAELERFREARPGDPGVEYLRARLELSEGDADAAVARLEAVIPELDDHATQYWLGYALEVAGDLPGAERRYQLSLARKPSEPAAYAALIRLAEQRGDWSAVASVAQVQIKQLPGAVEAWIALGAAMANLERGVAAEELAKRAVERFPENRDLRYLLVASLRVQRRYDDALVQLDELVDLFGTTPDLVAERALIVGLDGRPHEGIELARAALETSPDSAPLHTALARLLFAVGDAAAGAKEVDRALELEPGDPTPLRVRAEFRTATGDLEAARADCERYLELRPNDPTMHFTLGVVSSQQGRLDEAIAAYRRAAELDETAFAPRNNLADLLAQRGDLDGALAAAQQAYAIAGANPYVMDTLGWLYLRKGLVDRAIGLLEGAHDAAPGMVDAQLHLALAYGEVDRSEDARRLLSDLRAREETNDELRKRIDDALATLE